MTGGKIKFNGKLLSVFIKKERLPNGNPVTLELVKHPGAALVIPFLSAGSILMLRQYRPVIKSYLYELPAGTLKKNERPSVCAKREIIEETGYAASKLKMLGWIYPVPGYSTEKINIFAGMGLKKMSRARPEEDEMIEVRAMTRQKVRSLFRSGRITDAKTISSLAMVGWL